MVFGFSASRVGALHRRVHVRFFAGKTKASGGGVGRGGNGAETGTGVPLTGRGSGD